MIQFNTFKLKKKKTIHMVVKYSFYSNCKCFKLICTLAVNV